MAHATAKEIADNLRNPYFSELIEKVRAYNANGDCPLVEIKIEDGVYLRFENYCPCHGPCTYGR